MSDLAAHWTRRQFLGTGACAAAATLVHASPGAAAACAVAACASGSFNGLRSFRIGAGSMWRPQHAVPLPRVAHLAAHPSLPVVYACHDAAAHGHRQRGVVSAWRVHAEDGALQPMGPQPLSPGATHPHFAAVVANGSALVVLTRSGIYNVLKLRADGSIGEVFALRKEHGSAATGRTALPRHAAEHPDGTLLIVDSGQEVLSRFHLHPDGLVLLQRLAVHPGTGGARQVVLSRCGRRAYTLHAESGSIRVHGISSAGVKASHQTVRGNRGEACLLLHPRRSLLLRADSLSLTAFPLDPASGEVAATADTLPLALRLVMQSPDGSHLFGVRRATGDLVMIPLLDSAGVFGRPCAVVHLPGCQSLVLPRSASAAAGSVSGV